MSKEEDLTDEQIAERWPSASLAYDFVLPSYDWALHRITSHERRVDRFLTVATTLTLASPGIYLVARGQNAIAITDLLCFPGLFGIVAIGLFVLAMGIAIYSRQMGEITLRDVTDLHQERLGLPPNQFKLDTIAIAGRHLDRNLDLVRSRWKWVNFSMGLFGLELLCWIAWIIF